MGDCDSSNIESFENLFKEMDKQIGTPNLVIYNPSENIGRYNIIRCKDKTQDSLLYYILDEAFLVDRKNRGLIE